MTSILFHEDLKAEKQRLFSAGMDGDLIEYRIDVHREDSFSIQTRYNLVESPIYIRSLAIYSLRKHIDCLVCSMSNGRIKFFDLTTKKCQHTLQTLPSPFVDVRSRDD